MSYEKRRAISGGHSAFFDFAQNEEEFDMPSTAYLILSEVEGRTAPMQCSKICACPSAFAGATRRRVQPETIRRRRDGPSPLGKGELCAERDEGGGEGAAHPCQHKRARDHVGADRRREQPVADEDGEGQEDEDGAQLAHARERPRATGADELRQEGKEEDRQLRIEDVGQDGGNDDLGGRAAGDPPPPPAA